jgi:hypothetical protein
MVFLSRYSILAIIKEAYAMIIENTTYLLLKTLVTVQYLAG